MIYEESHPAEPSVQLKELLEALWTLEDLHRQLIKQIHRYVKLQEGVLGQPVGAQDLAALL